MGEANAKASKDVLNDHDIKIEYLQDQLLTDINPQALRGILQKIDILKSSALAHKFLDKGDKAVDFTLPNAIGKQFNLAKLCNKGKVVLTFFRGGWCPYCYVELRKFQNLLAKFKSLGAQIIAISSERPDYCLNTMERNGLEFEVLCDKGNKVAQEYNLVYKSESEIDLWDELGLIKTAITNGDISYELPVPATYIIDENMVIRYAYANPDYRRRANPQDVLNILAGLERL